MEDQNLQQQLNEQKETLLEYAKEKMEREKEVEQKIALADKER